MTFTKTLFKVTAIVLAAFFLTSILTVELEEVNRNSKVKYPVCVDSGVELAAAAYYDPMPNFHNVSSGFILPPGIEHIISQIHLSSHLYRGPPATHSL